MAEKQDLQKEIKELRKRLGKLESQCNGGAGQHSKYHQGDPGDRGLGSCNLPDVPEREFGPEVSPYRASLLRYIGKKWVNGTKLKYFFFTDNDLKGKASNLDLVRRGFDAWAELGIGIEFEETSSIDDAQVRIGFKQNDGAWSYVGRDVIDIPGRFERTMNFGWDLTTDPRGDGLDTPIHEIGHTLGFPHEHQNPFSGIVWDEDAVYEYFGGAPNFWSRESTFHNVLRKLDRNEVSGSEWDPNSIMHYSFGRGMIREPAEYRDGLSPTDGLTETDIEEVRKFYPPMNTRDESKLEPFKLEMLSLEPAEQKNYSICPTRTDEYTMQTFGQSDVVMVLFEDVDGELVYLQGDDDSGTALNAKITARLVKNRKYVLRIRMYLNYASGDSAVLLW